MKILEAQNQHRDTSLHYKFIRCFTSIWLNTHEMGIFLSTTVSVNLSGHFLQDKIWIVLTCPDYIKYIIYILYLMPITLDTNLKMQVNTLTELSIHR